MIMVTRRVCQVIFLLGASLSPLLFNDFATDFKAQLAPLQQAIETNFNFNELLDGPTTSTDAGAGSGSGYTSSTAREMSEKIKAGAAANAAAAANKQRKVPYYPPKKYVPPKKYIPPPNKSVMVNPNATFSFNATTYNAPVCEQLTADQVDFTMAIHLSQKRMNLMSQHCRRWENKPMSVAVGTHLSLGVTVQTLKNMGCNMTVVDVSVVMFKDQQDSYPVNTLRNMALSGVKTSHAMLLDADFVPSIDLHWHLMKHQKALTDPKQTIVVPAFEIGYGTYAEPAAGYIVPETKKALLAEFGFPGNWDKQGETGERKYMEQYAFNFQVNAGGHNSTNYTRWVSQSSRILAPVDCIASPRYEPYLVLRYCRDLPPYQEAFTGYGQNKITWMMQFMRSGYKLSQLGKGFVIHIPHAMSADKVKWFNTKTGLGRETLLVEQIANDFYDWMNTTVPDRTVVGECPEQPAHPIPIRGDWEKFRKIKAARKAVQWQQQNQQQQQQQQSEEVPGYFNLNRYRFCRITPAPQEGRKPVAMSGLPLPLEHQCAGAPYNMFAKDLGKLIKTEYIKKSPRWGKRTFLLPFLSPEMYSRRERSILIMGNSHTQQLVSTLLCQLKGQVLNTTVLYKGEEDRGTFLPKEQPTTSMALEIQLTQNTKLYVIVNCPFVYSPIWDSVLESVIKRPLESIDAFVLGQFMVYGTTTQTGFKNRMLQAQQQHPEWEMDFENNDGPNIRDVAKAYDGPIVFADMFAKNAETHYKRTVGYIRLLNAQNRTNIRAVNSRRYVRKLKAQVPVNATRSVDECATDEWSTVATCATNRSSLWRYQEGHRCLGAHGGHPDLIAWDVMEALHYELSPYHWPLRTASKAIQNNTSQAATTRL